MNDKQLETKVVTAIVMFVMKLNEMTDNIRYGMAEALSDKIETNTNISVEEITQEVARQFISVISKEFELGGTEDETKS